MAGRTKRAVGIRDVANHAAVSIGTVSRVMNNHPGVEADLRLRVLRTATELGYVHRHPQPERYLAVSEVELENTSQPTLSHVTFCCRSLLSPQTSLEVNPYFTLVLQGAEAECRQQGLHLSYRIIEDDASELARAKEVLAQSKTEALILVNFINQQLVEGLLNVGLPTVLVDHYFPELALDTVMSDGYQGTFLAMQHLLEHNHRRIAFVDGLKHYTIERRFDAYRRALARAGIEYRPEWVVPGDLSIEGGQQAGEEFLRRKLDCTAVFCSNDDTAFGLIQTLTRSGLNVPRDISVVGFDDVNAAARLITPPLTTVRANVPVLGQQAVRKLLERIRNPNSVPIQTLVHTDLVIRSSVIRREGS